MWNTNKEGPHCDVNMSSHIEIPARSEKAPAILVVDEEVSTRVVIADYLRDCGYRVFEAGTSEDAVTILSSELKIDIVFTDLELPGHSSGLGLARWVRRRHPDMRVIVTSGVYSSAELAGELCEAGPPIVKPYESDAVVQRIRSLTAN
jgi:DNA-binding NtrC family response regulator